MVKVVVSGACGRMGSGILSRIAEDKGLEAAGALEKKGHPELGKFLYGVQIVAEIKDIPEWDVLVEFASPEAALSHLSAAAEKGGSAVIGTTGFSPSEKNRLESYAAKMPLLVSPNMSIGVNVLLKIAETAARSLGADFDIEIVEAHHNKKKDAPSGTAARIAEVVSGARDAGDNYIYGRHGLKIRKAGEIGIHSVRGGTVTGEHTVMFAGESERLEIIHRAESRDIFVYGTLKAVKFISKASPGLYTMSEVIAEG
jgi:4-hydroxy-tetrahydrodipicolinate reductase